MTTQRTRLNEESLVTLLRQRCDEAGGIKRWAQAPERKVSADQVKDVLRYKIKPPIGVCLALGYRRVVEYEAID